MGTFPTEIITNPEWKRRIAAARATPAAEEKPKRVRTHGATPEWKEWRDRMVELPGAFLIIEPMPNWANDKSAKRWTWSMQRNQHLQGWLMGRAAAWNFFRDPHAYVVTMTRYGPKILDDDGLAASLKYFRDGVAEYLGIDDGETDRLTFVPRQAISNWYGLRIEIDGK